jgi:hypothetical protein
MKWVIRIGVVAAVLAIRYATRSRPVERTTSRASRPSASVASGKTVLKPVRFRVLVVEALRASAIGVVVEEKGGLRIGVRYPKGKDVTLNLETIYEEYKEEPSGLNETLANIEATAREQSLGSA